MPERPSRQESSLWDEIGHIVRTKEAGKPLTRYPVGRQGVRVPYRGGTARALKGGRAGSPAYIQSWLEIHERTRFLSRADFGDDAAELRRDVDTLRFRLEQLARQQASLAEAIGAPSKLLPETPSTQPVDTHETAVVCGKYVGLVGRLAIVRKILLVRDEEGTTVWTVIEAAPFEDSLRVPIYEAQFEALRSAQEGALLDFYVLNTKELTEGQDPEGILPEDARVLLER